MHPNEHLIETFYSCFGQRNYIGMRECYAADIEFRDPIFTLKGEQVGSMWQMLCEAGKDLQITASRIQANDTHGSAYWEARYTWSSTGRQVYNRINAEFRFVQGQINWHRDRFSLWRWTRMALGPAGLLFGWTPPVQKRIRQTAYRNLERFIAAQPQ